MSDKVIKQLTRDPFTRKASEFVRMVEKGTAKFENAVQRNLTWDNDRKSLLIHSMIINSAIPPFYASRSDKVYDFLDGKQRSNAIITYMHDEFALSNVPVVEYEDDDESIDINGKKYSELPEEIQEAIKTYMLSIVPFNDLTEDQEAELFYRLNNGKPMSAIEITRVRAKALPLIKEITLHPIFEEMITNKAKARYTDEDIVIKTFAMLLMEEPCLDTKEIRPFTVSLAPSKEEVDLVIRIFDKIKECHDVINEDNPKLARKLYVRTHFWSIVPLVRDHMDEDLTSFFLYFFDGGMNSTVSDLYNQNCSSGSGHVQNVRCRMNELEKEFKKHTCKQA